MLRLCVWLPQFLQKLAWQWKVNEWQVAKIETEKLLAATVHNELENRRSSGFLVILVTPCGSSAENNWTYKSIGKECQFLMFPWIMQVPWLCQISHVDWKEPSSGIKAPFLLNSMHLDTKEERACTALGICHAQTGIASCCTASWRQSGILMDFLGSLLDRN